MFYGRVSLPRMIDEEQTNDYNRFGGKKLVMFIVCG